MNKSTKSRLLVRSPDERYVFFGQGKQRSCNVRVVLDKAAVKVTKAEEKLKVFEFFRLWPLGNAGDFGRVHFNFAM